MAVSYRDFVEPRASGLPNWRVVTWFPALIALGAILLIVLNISGTSSGAHWMSFGSGDDPRRLLGGPRPIRSDEWLVQQGWIVSQVQQGFPVFNHTLPGGMDTTVLNELPNWDWSTLFRPHMWGYLFFGLDAGTAWQWWVPALGLVSGCYLLAVTLMPRRAMTAAVVAAAVFFSPIFQWWYGPNALWPAAWSLLAMAGTIWVLRDARPWVRVVWACLLGWLAVTMAIGLYVPFMLPSVLVFVFFFIGAVLQELLPWRRGALLALAGRVAPLAIAGVGAIAITGVWVVTRLGTIDAIGSTVYPGQRSDPTGQLLVQDPYLSGIGGAPFGQSFGSAGVPTLLGPNPSESATAILLAVFLLPALIWFIARNYGQRRQVDWLMVSTVAGLLLVLAYLLVPGWDPIARLLMLDRVPVSRFRMGFAVMLPLFFALVAREVDRTHGGRNRPIAILCGALATAFTAYVLVRIWVLDPATLQISWLWPVAAVTIIATVLLVHFHRWIPVAAVCLLVASITIGAAVNPFYRGIFDLNGTKIGQKVAQVNGADHGTWVGVGSYETMAVLMESGAEAFSGVQPYPPKKMWQEIDPGGTQKEAWDRLGHVRWTFGGGEPVVSNPQRDVILSTFDACSVFAQKYVDYVLSDETPESSECLHELADVKQGHSEMRVYEVVPSI